MTPMKLYRVVAISRAITWTLLFAGLIMRATTGFAPVVTIGGSIHGLVSSRPKRHGGAHRRQPGSTFLTGQFGFLGCLPAVLAGAGQVLADPRPVRAHRPAGNVHDRCAASSEYNTESLAFQF